MSASAIDPSTLHMREEAHLNGGDKWFGYIHRCVEHPRISRKDVYTRKDRSVTSEWRVDGDQVADFAAALLSLETPPVVSAEERAILATVADEPADRRSDAFHSEEPVMVAWHSLREKGLIDWNKGRVSRTPAGRAILAGDGA